MIRYELKDKSRQEAFEKALPGFTEALKRACSPMCGVVKGGQGIDVHNFAPGTGWVSGEWSISLPTDDIEVIEEYDPNKWNNYPEVTPPEGVWMRCEGETAGGRIIRDAAIFLRGKWRWWEVGPDAGMLVTFDIKRFRPWDDEE